MEARFCTNCGQALKNSICKQDGIGAVEVEGIITFRPLSTFKDQTPDAINQNAEIVADSASHDPEIEVVEQEVQAIIDNAEQVLSDLQSHA